MARNSQQGTPAKTATLQCAVYSCKGRYAAFTDRGKTTKFYRDIELQIPTKVFYQDGYNKVKVEGSDGVKRMEYWPKIVRTPHNVGNIARWFIKKFLLAEALQTEKEDFAGIKTINLKFVGLRDVPADTPNIRDIFTVPVKDMTEPELMAAVALTGGSDRVDFKSYQDLDDKAEATAEWLQSQGVLTTSGRFVPKGIRGKKGTVEEWKDPRVLVRDREMTDGLQADDLPVSISDYADGQDASVESYI